VLALLGIGIFRLDRKKSMLDGLCVFPALFEGENEATVGRPDARFHFESGAGNLNRLVILACAIKNVPAYGGAESRDNLYAILVGGGCSHGNPETPNGIIRVDVDHQSFSYVANLSVFQLANPIANPGPSIDDWEPDGTWYSMAVVHGEFYAAEPNHQEIGRISPTTGAVHRVADISASSSKWVGPTGMVCHGNLFFGNLAPFPVVSGSASVHKLTPSGNFKTWDPGFTTVVGVAFDYRDRLYVLELSDAAGFPTPGEGKLVRISASGELRRYWEGW
jgi:hypothetical protein